MFDSKAFSRTDNGSISDNFIATGVYYTLNDTIGAVGATAPTGSVDITSGTYFANADIPAGGMVVTVDCRLTNSANTVRAVGQVFVKGTGTKSAKVFTAVTAQ